MLIEIKFQIQKSNGRQKKCQPEKDVKQKTGFLQ